MKKELEIAKKIITEEVKKHDLEVKSLFLFGSRAKGNFDEESDWDFYVIINKDIDFGQKRKIILGIRRRLSEIKMPSDIIIQSEDIVNQRKTNTGYLTYYVIKEGMKI